MIVFLFLTVCVTASYDAPDQSIAFYPVVCVLVPVILVPVYCNTETHVGNGWPRQQEAEAYCKTETHIDNGWPMQPDAFEKYISQEIRCKRDRRGRRSYEGYMRRLERQEQFLQRKS